MYLKTDQPDQRLFRRPSKRRGIIAGLILVGIASAVAVNICPLPWFAALLAGSALLACGAMASGRNAVKISMLCAAAIVLGLAAFEAFLGIEQLIGDGTRMEGSITDGFTRPDDILGYAPQRGSRVSARKFYGDTLIYDVVYTIGANGLRISPPANQNPRQCVVFFGDSVTFGEGVNDRESFPYQVGLKTDGEFEIFNLAFSGYGPHQMLASLQSHRFEEAVDCRPTHFIYLSIREHLARVAGLAPWDRHGPRYTLRTDGTLVRDGNFDSPRPSAPAWIGAAIRSSRIGQRFFGYGREADAADIELFLAVVRESARLAHERYPDSRFHVILWDARNDQVLSAIESNLRAVGIGVYRLTSIISDSRVNWGQYVLDAHDTHPNARSYELLADFVVDQMLRVRIGDDAQQAK